MAKPQYPVILLLLSGWLTCAFALPEQRTFGGMRPAVDLSHFVSDAEIIVAGRFASVPPLANNYPGGPGFLPVCAPAPGSDKAILLVDKILKGAPVGPRIAITAGCMSTELVGRYLLLFLKSSAGELIPAQMEFLLPGAPGANIQGLSPHDAVVAECAAVAASPSAEPGDKGMALSLIQTDHSPAAAEALRRIAPTLTSKARIEGLAALLSQGDPAALAPSLAILGDRSAWAAARLVLLPSIAHAPLGAEFLPVLSKLYTSAEVADRRAAVSAITQGGTWALPLLGQALDDPDLGVRHLAVFALGQVAHQPAWGGPPYAPGRGGADPFVQHEATYIAYWKQWLAQHPQP